MNAKAAIALINIPVYLGFGLYVLYRDPQRRSNRLFVILTIALALWGVGDCITLLAQTTSILVLGRKVAATGWLLIAPVTVHFTLSLVRSRWLKNVWLMSTLYAFFGVMVVLTWTTGIAFRSYTVTPQGFHLLGGPLRIPLQALALLILLLCAVALLAKGLKLKDRMERDRLVLMGLAILVPVIGVIAVEVLIPYKGVRPLVTGLNIILVMAAIMAYAISRRGLLSDLLTSMGGAVMPVMKDPVFVLNPSGMIEATNPAAARFTGYGEEETRGLTLQKIFPDEAQYQRIQESISTGTGFDGTSDSVLKDGSTVPVAIDLVPVKSHPGRVIGFVVILHDMSAVLDLIRAQEREHMATREADMQRDYSNELRNIIDVANHELRHPAAVFKGYTSTLINHWDQLDRKAVDDFLKAMDMASDRLTRLTVDLLDTSYIESEGIQLVYSDVLPRALETSAVMEVATRGNAGRFEVAGPDDDTQISVDAEKVESVLAVLLDNAGKFSPEGSPVEAGFRMEKDQVVFFVADRGRGVPEGQREKIFQRLYQVDDALHHSMPGLGLGLYIAEKIVAAHHGWIKAEAREGGGSVFSFGIPLKSNGR